MKHWLEVHTAVVRQLRHCACSRDIAQLLAVLETHCRAAEPDLAAAAIATLCAALRSALAR
jgi:hypothetical protein